MLQREAQKVDRECRDAIQSLKSEQAADQQAQISVFDQIVRLDAIGAVR